MKHSIDSAFYPGWVRKAITFSIDDGNLNMDSKFIDIVKDGGIRGCFNLCSERLSRMTPEQYRKFYAGHEIANHCKYHPFALKTNVEYKYKNEQFDVNTADPEYLYPYHDIEGLYFISTSSGRWRKAADTEYYIKFIADCHRELEEVFGVGSVRCFVWPFGRQENEAVVDYATNFPGYYGARRASRWGSSDGFPLPPDLKDWCCTATHRDLLELAQKYSALDDDGDLKFFCIGLHSIDFENEGKWDDLRSFVNLYGSRPEEYYYATPGEIFDYAAAVRNLHVTDAALVNPSDIDLYLLVDSERRILRAGETIHFD